MDGRTVYHTKSFTMAWADTHSNLYICVHTSFPTPPSTTPHPTDTYRTALFHNLSRLMTDDLNQMIQILKQWKIQLPWNFLSSIIWDNFFSTCACVNENRKSLYHTAVYNRRRTITNYSWLPWCKTTKTKQKRKQKMSPKPSKVLYVLFPSNSYW